jgi:hypothetical protein
MICAGEFIMADEAFALSPISARAAQPREEDYEAISDAFMETSRGRWFLTEYARRNRNADTRMVLDAVARIEDNLAAQKPPASDSGLAEALAAIRSAVDDAKASVSTALDDLALEETLAPVRKGARVIREIAWRLREIGADGRICDLIDSQLSVIEAGCGQLGAASPMTAVSAAFDLVAARISEFDGDTASPQAKAAPRPSPAASDEAHAVTPESEEDDAILDMIALEMAAVDPSDADDPFDIDETDVTEPLAAPEMVAQIPEPVAAPARPPTVQPSPQVSLEVSPEVSLKVSHEVSRQVSREVSHEVSLGATLIANGIARRPHAPASDPLAPIRRMSQAEKIAFFS